ncbi:hypothetical protein ACSBR2_028085 [Camellia fascicularis]
MTSINWEEGKDWYTTWTAPAPGNPCDVYGFCGTFGACNNNNTPICQCLKGFVPNSAEEWSKGNWTGGCVRRTELPCQKNISTLANATAKNDGFWQISKVKLPDNYQSLLTVVDDTSDCQQWCLNNCSCVAYAFPAGIGCLREKEKNLKSMCLGDLCFFYHFDPKARRIVGVVSVVQEWYEDDDGAVDVRAVGEMKRSVDLKELKGDHNRRHAALVSAYRHPSFRARRHNL